MQFQQDNMAAESAKPQRIQHPDSSIPKSLLNQSQLQATAYAPRPRVSLQGRNTPRTQFFTTSTQGRLSMGQQQLQQSVMRDAIRIMP